MFHVWNAVISLSTVEPKSAMHNGNQGNRGLGNWEWSRVEWNRAEQSRIRIIRIKIKEKCDIITQTREAQSMTLPGTPPLDEVYQVSDEVLIQFNHLG